MTQNHLKIAEKKLKKLGIKKKDYIIGFETSLNNKCLKFAANKCSYLESI